MASLANLERPMTFSDAIGERQKRNARILMNMGKRNAYSQTYLFSGMRGCGKTTYARILAKAINCENLTDEGEPCCKCPSCTKIQEETSPDVIEMNAANDNGIAFARELEEKAGYMPFELKKKVYILDECHQMTKDAFNALLKILEQPPEWTVFILATTNPEKVPMTIKSRLTMLTFDAVSREDIAKHLLRVAGKYGAELSSDAAELIARRSNGSIRDAIRDLETCLMDDSRITQELAAEVLGSESWENIASLINAVSKGDQKDVIARVRSFYERAKVISCVVDDAITMLSAVIVEKAGGSAAGDETFRTALSGVEASSADAYLMADTFGRIRRDGMYDETSILIALLRGTETEPYALNRRVTELENLVRQMSDTVSRLSEGGVAFKEMEERTQQPVVEMPAVKLPNIFMDEEGQEGSSQGAVPKIGEAEEKVTNTEEPASSDTIPEPDTMLDTAVGTTSLSSDVEENVPRLPEEESPSDNETENASSSAEGFDLTMFEEGFSGSDDEDCPFTDEGGISKSEEPANLTNESITETQANGETLETESDVAKEEEPQEFTDVEALFDAMVEEQKVDARQKLIDILEKNEWSAVLHSLQTNGTEWIDTDDGLVLRVHNFRQRALAYSVYSKIQDFVKIVNADDYH